MIGHYTGARINELAQLKVADIVQEGGAWCIAIRKTVDADLTHNTRVRSRQSLKGFAAVRTIPIPQPLLEAGFLDFLADMRACGHPRLFPHLSAGVNKKTNQTNARYSQGLLSQFGGYLKTLGFGKGIGFHAFRHTFATELHHKGVPEEDIALVTGHSIKKKVPVLHEAYFHKKPAVARMKQTPRARKLQADGESSGLQEGAVQGRAGSAGEILSLMLPSEHTSTDTGHNPKRAPRKKMRAPQAGAPCLRQLWSFLLATVFISYCHADEAFRDQLDKQLKLLQRQGVIDVWHDRAIPAGADFAVEIDEHINNDDIILLLVSSDFLASNYCFEIEMARAMERHEAGEAIVIPVILRACDWTHAPFGKLNAVPTDGKPVKQWTDVDEAFLQVAKAVRAAANRIDGAKSPAMAPTLSRSAGFPAARTPMPPSTGPRSSNLTLAKNFSQRDKDVFLNDTFRFVSLFFENSLAELQSRNDGYECVFQKVDERRFYSTIYCRGRDVAKATVYLGDMIGPGIYYIQGHNPQSNTMSESLSVGFDDQTLFLKSSSASNMGSNREQKLSQDGAAELLWKLLIEPLQRSQNW